METLYISIDESGTFASGDQFFVFCGYAVLGSQRYTSKARKYLGVEQQITKTTEVKANKLDFSDKQNLLDVMANEVSFGLAIKNKSLPTRCYTDNLAKSIIKDDMLRNIILEVIAQFDVTRINKINIEIDEQNFVFGIKQNLYIGLYRELQSGYYNRNQFIKPTSQTNITLQVSYVDSKHHPMVRAADILANVVFKKLEKNQDVYSVLKIFKVL